ncbi:MAG: DUF4406 domain-containing protein [Bacteroides sp.]|nr:DUF4406 domain-containing protein [Eubacterium sp.]MCM1417651.1 DUF4406 domain-containing protein [Roseburia sp.]MCM1461884.1 DUF4406 domain-containing protein [Bacteroides sp.]
MKVYLSGKITGTDDYVERFAEAEREMREAGYEVLNPVTECAKLPEETTWSEYMRVCIALLTQADAIYRLKDWRESIGAWLEFEVASALELKIMDEKGDEREMKISETKYTVVRSKNPLSFLTVDGEFTSEITEGCLFSEEDARDIAAEMSDEKNRLEVVSVKAVYDVQLGE